MITAFEESVKCVWDINTNVLVSDHLGLISESESVLDSTLHIS